ncbi:MAG TPA: hypothetical protein VED63_03690, partial [Acidimicrobiales bacterium]|nr:hypothetical protein [Acidimicrobiales bacterium]
SVEPPEVSTIAADAGVPAHPVGPASHGGALDTWVSAAGSGPTVPPSRHRRRGRVLVAAAVAVVFAAAAVGAGVVASGNSSTSTGSTGDAATASRLVREALAAATGAGTFHYVSVSASQGVSQTTIGDAAPDRGRQEITIGSTETFTVLVIGTTVYFQGNAASMQDQLELDPVVAQQHAEQWISLQPSDAPYQSVYAAVTTASALSDSVTISAQEQLAPTTVDATRVIPIEGALLPVDQTPTRGTAHLYVRARGSPLPVSFTASGVVSGQATTFRTTFSEWGEPVVVQAPTGALAYSSVAIGGLGQNGNPTVLT